LELYYYAELNLPEIAQVLNRNLNTVKYQFYRAHTQVAAAMGNPETWLNGGLL
jgi:DNA-directed RNA polymerase specialized sigma24 family protein